MSSIDKDLIDAAVQVVGSRQRLCELLGWSKRHLAYHRAGVRYLFNGGVRAVPPMRPHERCFLQELCHAASIDISSNQSVESA